MLADGNTRVSLWGDWTVDVREDGRRHFVDLALGPETRSWKLVDRLQLHVCATRALEPRAGVLVAPGTPLYLRGVTNAEITVASSAALVADTFAVPRDAVSLESCTSEPLPPIVDQQRDARTFDGLPVPAGTPIVELPGREGTSASERRAWAMEAGERRWWLVRTPPDEEAPRVPERGTLSREAIRSVIRTKSSEYQACYESRLASAPDLAGRLVMLFVIAPTGAVEIVQAEDGPGAFDLPLEACVARVLAGLRFPQPTGGGIVIVHYPFVFAQRDRNVPAPSTTAPGTTPPGTTPTSTTPTSTTPPTDPPAQAP